MTSFRRTGRGTALRVGMPGQAGGWRKGSSPRTVTRLLIVGLFLAIVAGLLLATIKQSLAFLVDNPAYAIANIDVREPSYLTVDEVVALSGVSKGQNLLLLPIQEVRKRLLEHPNIKDAVVQRALPNTLRIEVKEREPLAQISIGKNYLVDADGAILTWNDKFGRHEWPLIEGLDMKSKVVDNKIESEALRDALQVLQLFHGSILMTRMEIQKARLDVPGGYLFTTDGDMTLRMTPGMRTSDIQEKFKKLAAVVEDLRRKGINAQTIDLRFNDIIVTPKGAAPKALKSAAGKTMHQGEKKE